MSNIFSFYAPILVYDSGIGGISTLCELKRALPHEDFVYFADFLNSPYGNKTKTCISKIVLNNIRKLIRVWQPKAIVLACNTATSVCAQKLRQIYPNTIIIGLEPAIKPAILSGVKNILVLATKATLKHSRVVKLLLKPSNCRVTLFNPNTLAKVIDKHFLNPQKLKKGIERILAPYKAKYDAVVLGCTHYVLAKNYILNVLGVETSFDGNVGAAKRLNSLLGILGLNKNVGEGRMTFLSSLEKKEKFLQHVFLKQEGRR